MASHRSFAYPKLFGMVAVSGNPHIQPKAAHPFPPFSNVNYYPTNYDLLPGYLLYLVAGEVPVH